VEVKAMIEINFTKHKIYYFRKKILSETFRIVAFKSIHHSLEFSQP